jgi:S1-C subfamily serine protease
VVPQLIRNGRARTAFLGVSVSEGTRVRTVAPDGPADDAGIRPGDVIRSIGGRDTSEEGAVASAVAARRPGQRVAVRLARRTVTVTLGAQPRR